VKRRQRPAVITSAERSPAEERRSREVRYLLMMSVRALCLVAATVLITVRPPLLWLWLAICAVGMVVVPWLAVILANLGSVPEDRRWLNRRHRSTTLEADPRALPSAAPPRVIDGEE
jgi:Protein of unknown function (DUF3099)